MTPDEIIAHRRRRLLALAHELTSAVRGVHVDDPSGLEATFEEGYLRLGIDAPGLPRAELVAAIQTALEPPAPPAS